MASSMALTTTVGIDTLFTAQCFDRLVQDTCHCSLVFLQIAYCWSGLLVVDGAKGLVLDFRDQVGFLDVFEWDLDDLTGDGGCGGLLCLALGFDGCRDRA